MLCFLYVLSHVQPFVTPRIAAHQAPLPMGFSKQAYWSSLSFPSPRELPKPGVEPTSPLPLALAGGFFTTEPPGNPGSSEKSSNKCRLLFLPWQK